MAERKQSEFYSSIMNIIVLFLALTYIYLVVILLQRQPLDEYGTGVDFAGYYFSSIALKRGVDFNNPALLSTIKDSEGRYSRLPYVYPPLLAVLLLPLTVFDLSYALKAWILLSQIAICATLWLYYASSARRGFDEFKADLLIFLLFLVSLVNGLTTGQVTIIILMLFLLFYYAYKKNLSLLAGISLGVSTLIKPLGLVFYPYLIFKRQFKTTAIALLTVSILLSSIALFFGTNIIKSSLENVLNSFFTRTSVESDLFQIESPVLKMYKIVIGLFFLVLLYIVCKKGDKETTNSKFDLEYAFLLASIIVLMPAPFFDDYIYLVLPFWILYGNRKELLSSRTKYLALTILLLIISPTTHISLYAIYALWLLLLYLTFKR